MSITSNQLSTNSNYLAKFRALDQSTNKTMVTYVYANPNRHKVGQICAKTRVVDFVPKHPDDLPLWDNGTGDLRVEILIRPVRLYRDPFRGRHNMLALCELLNTDGKPIDINRRHSCVEAMDAAAKQHPWFGAEQEYMLFDGYDPRRPLGWPTIGQPDLPWATDLIYDSGVGANTQYGRDVAEAHLLACLYAGVMIGGQNGENQPAQWEYQVGPCEGIQLGDDLIMSRYILLRVAEDLHIGVTFDPRPVPGWLGSGAHMNFSTEAMRREGDLAEINRAIEALGKNHSKHMAIYDPMAGEDNKRRLTGEYGTNNVQTFTSGVADRSASVRIPKRVEMAGKGYLEDRRPAANCDPYAVTEALVRTVCLNE